MCDGFKIPETVREFGLTKQAVKCVQCGSYEFEPEIKKEYAKCKHGIVDIYCGICERVERRKDAKGNK